VRDGATLMGIAIQHHVVHGVEDSIADYLPNLPRDGKEKIRIRDEREASYSNRSATIGSMRIARRAGI
jgi:hypothetical protein